MKFEPESTLEYVLETIQKFDTTEITRIMFEEDGEISVEWN